MNNSDKDFNTTMTIIDNWMVTDAEFPDPEIGRPLLVQAIILHNTEDKGKLLIELNLDDFDERIDEEE